MNIKLVSKLDFPVDTVVRFVKFNTAPNFTCTELQAAYDTAFGGDSTDLAVGEIKTLRLKVGTNFINLTIVGFDCSLPTAFDDFRRATAKLGTVLNELKSKNVFVDKLMNLIFADKCEIMRQFTSVLPLCEYSFDTYLSKKSDIPEKTIYILAESEHESAAKEGEMLARGICIARDFVNEPAETLTPAELAARAVAFGKEFGFDAQIYDKKACEELGMGLFLAVGRASVNEPKLIVMRYNGGGNEAPLGIVGKGLTYDSGGLALKQTAGMLTMKSDMAGSAATIGAMCAIAAQKLPKNVVAVVAACENLVDGTGYRNGDIFTGMAGKSVLIGSTDAEGRLTMADAITYIVRKENVSSIVELSTLTGSCAGFFGKVCAGALSTDDALFAKADNAQITGEKYGRMPAYDEYREFIKPTIADLYNTSLNGAGGICAGLFLDEFREGVPFLHLDIAGTTFASAKSDCQPEGGTGFGVKTVYEYVKNA